MDSETTASTSTLINPKDREYQTQETNNSRPSMQWLVPLERANSFCTLARPYAMQVTSFELSNLKIVGCMSNTNTVTKKSRYTELFRDMELKRRSNALSASAVTASVDFEKSNSTDMNRLRQGPSPPADSVVRSPSDDASHQNSPPANDTRREEIMALSDWRRREPLSQRQRSFSKMFDSNAVAKNPARTKDIANQVRELQIKIFKRYGEGSLQVFLPSWSAMQASGLIPDIDIYRAAMTHDKLGSQSNYRGDTTVPENLSMNISDEENCAVWILGLPANVTYRALFKGIRNVGKVCNCWINIAEGHHQSSAVKMVFFTRKEAKRMFDFVSTGNYIVTGQKVTNIRWNKNKSAAYSHPSHSRVLRITGPEDLMDFGYFEHFFELRFTYQLDHKCIADCSDPGMVSHEWYFASVRSQSAFAKTAIDRELKGIYAAEYVLDPCSAGWL